MKKFDVRKLGIKKPNIKKFNIKKFNINKIDLKKININKFNLKKFNIKNPNIKKINLKKIDIKKINIKKFIEKIGFKKININKFNLKKFDIKSINIRKPNINKIHLKKNDMKKFDIKRINFKKINIRKYVLVIIAAIIFASDIYISNNLNISSFEHCIYSLIKMEGSSSAPVLYAFIYISLVFIVLLFILILPVYDFGKKVCISIKDKVIRLYPISNIKMYGTILMVLSIFGLLYIVKFFPFVGSTIFSRTDLFDDYYVESSNVDITFPEKKRNLIYIFMESMEMTNVSIENGGVFEESIIPNLEKLAIDNINFSNDDDLGGAYQTFGVGWTVAAMIAHTSGTPLKMTFDDVNANSNRFTNVTSIGDILASNGYNNYLLIGSDSNFGGRKSYISNHNYMINDYHTAIEDGRLEEDYFEWWGNEDS